MAFNINNGFKSPSNEFKAPARPLPVEAYLVGSNAEPTTENPNHFDNSKTVQVNNSVAANKASEKTQKKKETQPSTEKRIPVIERLKPTIEKKVETTPLDVRTQKQREGRKGKLKNFYIDNELIADYELLCNVIWESDFTTEIVRLISLQVESHIKEIDNLRTIINKK